MSVSRWEFRGCQHSSIPDEIHPAQAVYTEYPDPSRNEWENKILLILRKFPVHVIKMLTNKSASMLRRTLSGKSRPRAKNRVQLRSALHRIGAL
jgi:hypothetical protein